MTDYRPRRIEALLRELLSEVPALLIVGPRGSGKTTTAMRHAATTVRLDQPREAEAFRSDPDAAIRGLAEPVLLDEWQVVPDVLGAVKRAVDAESRPGRFLLTGSVRADLDVETWPGTGRLVRVPLFGMSVAEQIGGSAEAALLDRLADQEVPAVPPDPPDLRGYVELALRSGFPAAALSLSDRTRHRWIESYIDQLLTRDAVQVEPGRDPAKLRTYFEAYALNSAGVVEERTLFEAARMNRKTAAAYEQLLQNLLVVERVPAWTVNRLKRLIRSPKRYVMDAALLAGILRADADAVMRDGDLLGRVLDTFVTAQLRAETTIAQTRPRLYHLRTEQGRHEVDLIGELAGRRVIGIEVKASSAPSREEAKHLSWLRDEVGDRFVAGVVFHTGPRAFELDKRILAVPIAALWA
ncbi:MAG TPA: DUF4143 domain-containing protein [Actinomycetota bacterium]